MFDVRPGRQRTSGAPAEPKRSPCKRPEATCRSNCAGTVTNGELRSGLSRHPQRINLSLVLVSCGRQAGETGESAGGGTMRSEQVSPAQEGGGPLPQRATADGNLRRIQEAAGGFFG